MQGDREEIFIYKMAFTIFILYSILSKIFTWVDIKVKLNFILMSLSHYLLARIRTLKKSNPIHEYIKILRGCLSKYVRGRLKKLKTRVKYSSYNIYIYATEKAWSDTWSV